MLHLDHWRNAFPYIPMKIHSTSFFKNEAQDKAEFESWVGKLEAHNGRKYERFERKTALGTTVVWGLNTGQSSDPTLVIFPGARTTSLIWDFDRGLDQLGTNVRIFLVETNGLPNLSEGATPDIKSLDYGHWAAEVLDQLGIQKAHVAGASFGGLICMKLAIVAPERVRSAILLNPGCLQPFSLGIKNLFYNILPIVKPSRKNVSLFLDKAIFCKPSHQMSDFAEGMLVDYEVFAISKYKDNTQKPYYMGAELGKTEAPVYVLLGDKDLLFPFQKSIDNAKLHIKNLKEIKVYPNVAHGIETYAPAIQKIREILEYNP